MVAVRTEEFCKAMGQPEGARLEDVRDFVREVVEFMQGFGMYMICGCAYLSLSVAPEERLQLALDENREPISFSPVDIDDYIDEYIADSQGKRGFAIRRACDADDREISGTKSRGR
ncbi:MAG: hypothetical protein JRJ19_02670 [Deltaproteobacteria bacterium]|nr:hypothetical protein [Deltaproteobacteria bacterium]MBW1870936.1 hypothetical protein [Deltaproteobacteria bacterium]